jgi:itaconate CoA-transferase
MNDLGEALDHPAIKARDLIKEVDSAVGKVKVFDFPPRSSEFESVNKLGPPVLGEHTAQVLAELGIDAATIETLVSAGVVQCAGPEKEKAHV